MPTRRLFLAILLVSTGLGADAAAPKPIRVVWVSTGAASPRLLVGARFGAGEARATAALLDRSFELVIVNAADPSTVTREAGRARASGAFVITGGLPAPMTSAAISSSAPLLAILPRDDTGGASAAWRIRPDAAAIARALAAVKLSAEERRTARVVAWHPSLQRFGASELNERFAKSTGTVMDEEAWLGWVAVKLVLESTLRGRPMGENRIDGHKGVMLRFDAARALRQPLFVVVRRDGREIVVNE